MRDSVSIRNITAQPTRLASRLRKSEAIPADDAARFLPLWPQELNDRSFDIERALREERRPSRAGNRAYDLARHAALNRMLKLERAALTELEPIRWSRQSTAKTARR